jgi:hypothetical protein
LLPLAIQPRRTESLAVAELALRAAEVVVAAPNVAEAEEAVELRQHTPTARAKRTSSLLCLPPSQMHGARLLRAMSSHPPTLGALLPLTHHLLSPRPHRALFQRVLRRAGQACLLRLHQPQRRHPPQLRSKFYTDLSTRLFLTSLADLLSLLRPKSQLSLQPPRLPSPRVHLPRLLKRLQLILRSRNLKSRFLLRRMS